MIEITEEERLSIKLASKASRCTEGSMAHTILVVLSRAVYDIGKFNHAMAHAFGYKGTGVEGIETGKEP